MSETIEILPLTGAMGAEIRGVDLSRPLDNRTADLVRQAFLDHLMIYFRDQSLTPDRQVDLARMFGAPAVYPFLKPVTGTEHVNELLKTETDTKNFGGGWHSDTTYKECPDLGTLLYAHEVPETGGDTLFTNTYLAYEALSEGMKRLISPLRAVNFSDKLYPGGRAANLANLKGMSNAKISREPMENIHPVVRTHPDTGRKALYVNISHSLRFDGMTIEESKGLLDYLSHHAVRPEFTCRLHWRPGSLAIWDNRCTQHFAVNDYPGQRRRMHRVTIEGDRPH